MSTARSEFIRSLQGIIGAIGLDPIAQGSSSDEKPEVISVLRRGILITGLVSLETFIRERTSEVLLNLERWPMSYDDLPERLRRAARLNALSHLQNFARMLKSQGEDYEAELRVEILKMASGHGSTIQFTKFVAGDYTGNLSDSTLKELLQSLQVNDCWNSFRTFSSSAGMGVPSVQEIVKGTIQRRHRSAHSASYNPPAVDIIELPSNLLCIAMCFDVSISASLEQALVDSASWSRGDTQWLNAVNLYLLRPKNRKLRLFRPNSARAIRLVDSVDNAKLLIPRPAAGRVAALIQQDSSGRPTEWTLL
jgi:hypothetical protein